MEQILPELHLEKKYYSTRRVYEGSQNAEVMCPPDAWNYYNEALLNLFLNTFTTLQGNMFYLWKALSQNSFLY